uniref:Uncharacterized protein n=1 Tax=Arundo donax TaxID=35708 RepID=A0A0A9FVX3_ARUDO
MDYENCPGSCWVLIELLTSEVLMELPDKHIKNNIYTVLILFKSPTATKYRLVFTAIKWQNRALISRVVIYLPEMPMLHLYRRVIGIKA